MDDCIFCKIVAKQEVSYEVYEDTLVKAFLARFYPISEGHTIVIPKKHYENIYDVPDEVLQRMVSVARKIALSYQKSLNANSVDLTSSSGKEAQQKIMHMNIHVIPRYDEEDKWDFKGRPELQGRLDLTISKIKKVPII